MEYRISNDNGTATVTFSGDITFSENVRFREMLKELDAQSITTGIFDISAVGMVDSAGLGMFLIAREQAVGAGWKLNVRGPQGHVASMLKLTKLSELLEG